MKCKHCDGDGVIVDVEYGHAGKYMCDYCWGTGVVEPMTEQEYLQTCNTEQLAKFIFWQHFDVYGKTLYELMVNASKGVSRDKQAEVMIGAVVEWLKQPHTNE